MNSQHLIGSLILLGALIGGSLPALAQEEPTLYTSQDFFENKAAIVEPGVLPNSFWYWSDVFSEEARYLFTVGKEKKADYLIEVGAERLAELKKLSEAGITKYADELLTQHDDKVKAAEKLYETVRAKSLEQLQKSQIDLEKKILQTEPKVKRAALLAPKRYDQGEDKFADRMSAGFAKVLSHLSWKRGQIQTQKANLGE